MTANTTLGEHDTTVPLALQRIIWLPVRNGVATITWTELRDRILRQEIRQLMESWR